MKTMSESPERKAGSAAVLVNGPGFECSICNARLVQICYQRSSPFRVFRKSLIAAMRWLAHWHAIDERVDADWAGGVPRLRPAYEDPAESAVASLSLAKQMGKSSLSCVA